MKKTSILHLITTAKNASPFDVNMAYDAGYEKIMPYTDVHLDEVVPLTQDAMFSRSPSGVKREALFFGGRDIHLALDMQKAAKEALFPPFEMSTFSDPSGAFTTAAAMVAKVDAYFKSNNQTLSEQIVAIFGANGTVGATAALIAAKHGATVHMMAHSSMEKMQAHVDNMQQRYDVKLTVIDGTSAAAKKSALDNATVCLCATPAGVRVLDLTDFSASPSLKVMADVNAVAPSAIEAVEVMTNNTVIEGTDITGFGALAIGQLKYITQNKLLESMLESDAALHLDYHHAFEFACANAT
ncbi:MAG: NAD(P)-dependent methylenetetrahydromethanopterin dehydrogenase [Methylophilaceae bacterium]